ncbi:hypothetical protein C5167_042842 [Papaver somniferum]|uniref:Uncharacterized protein n=1 Tax=Papaver somniferum TaxID=3469 RepID=A0A4Y7L506_PAPSO|nr:hypothetical protein C5167_042842 [Papaver somniferum]
MNHSCQYRQLQIQVRGNLRKQQFSGISSSIPVPPKVHSDREISCVKNCWWVRDFEGRKQYNKKNTCIAYNSSYKYVTKRIKDNSVIYEPNHTFGHIPTLKNIKISIAAVEIFFHVLTRSALWSSLTIFTAPFVQEIIQNGQGSCTGKKYFIDVAEFPLSDRRKEMFTVIHQATAFRKVCACHPQVGGLLELTFSCYSFLRIQYTSANTVRPIYMACARLLCMLGLDYN